MAAQPAPPGKSLPQIRTLHRVLHLGIFLIITVSEVGKVAYGSWINRGYGYWWVTLGGFTVGDGGAGGSIERAECALVAALLLLELLLGVLASLATPQLALGTHALVVAGLLALCSADLALFFGAAGARVSLPLVLFALSERQYVLHVAEPYLHVLLACAVGLAGIVVGLGSLLHRIVSRFLPHRRTPWTCKVTLLVALCARLWSCRISASNVGSDLLGQLGSDLAALAQGSLYSEELDAALLSHRMDTQEHFAPRPPLMVFHWEAGSERVLQPLRGNYTTAVPYLHSRLNSSEATLDTGIVTVPMTLKGAWEALCGMSPALTSDFREQGSALRRECLPRVLARCCGYHSILAKTDTQLPDMPRRVFGFSEVIVAPDNEELLAQLKSRLGELGALDGQKPVFVYFYAGDAHTPYTAGRVSDEERGFVEDVAEDVFLALHRRTDVVAERLAEFWPPPKLPGESWRHEHGLSIYFGDHGELMDDSAPHGNSLSDEVTRVFMLTEGRAFAQETVRPAKRGLPRRLADVFSTVVNCVGLRPSGRLHVGRSLLDQSGHEQLATFSFYRPSELAAVHLPEPDGEYRSWEFAHGRSGWKLAPGLPSNGTSAYAAVHAAVADREEVNSLLTRSNLHAAWFFAKLRAAAKQAKAAARAIASYLFPALPAASA